MKKKFIIILVCVGIISIVIFKLASNKKKINEKNRPAQIEHVRIPVTAVAVREDVKQTGLVKTGMLAPFKDAKVLAVSNGNIQGLLFELGDHVRQGQVLAVLDTYLLNLDLQKAQLNVAKLKRDLDTYTELLEGNAATREKVDDIRQNHQDALNQVDQLRRQIADASIKAPTSGVIDSKPVETGMYVTAGTEIASIVNLSSLKVQVYLTESEVYQVKEGQRIKLTTDVYPNEVLTGKVTFISPQANEAYNYKVEITATYDPSVPLRSGTFVRANFSQETTLKILLIPREALNESTQDASVYVVVDGKARLRKIRVATEYGSDIQVSDGLNPGEQVVTSGQINLRDGALINVSK